MEILKYLYFVFIETIIDLLEHMTEEDKVVIIPIEGLTEMPFQLLLDDNGIYLFEKFILSISPSMQTIKCLNDRFCTLQSYSLLEGSGSCLLVGDPAYENEMDRLISTREEVNIISSIFEEREVSTLLGTEASIQNVLDWGRQPPAGLPNEQEFYQAFVHFAVHCIVDKKHKKGALQLAHPGAQEYEPNETSDPDEDSESSEDFKNDEANEISSYSNAVAARASAEIGGVMKSRSRDGGSTSKDSDMLSSENIIGCGFDWRAFFVVLSACNSAKGKVLAEGVLNLPRAFLIAGVPCIVASQWRVDDDLTPKLMIEFYGLMKQGRDVATSLCLAMRSIKHSKEEEFHIWGAFNVWGLPTVCLPKEMQAGSYGVG